MNILRRFLWSIFFLVTPKVLLAVPPVDSPQALKLSIRSVVPRARSQAPQQVDLGVLTKSQKIFTGKLHLKWYLNKRLVHEYISPEISVTEGSPRFRVLVPQVIARAEKTPISIAGKFVMDDETVEFEEQAGPSFPPVWKRSFVLAIVQPQEASARNFERKADRQQLEVYDKGLSESLNLEQFAPFDPRVNHQSSGDIALEMLTNPSRLTPEELPQSAAGFAAFDMLLLEGLGFQMLRSKQLEALEQWAAAGGSIVVYPTGKLSQRQVDFLNRVAPLTEADPSADRPVYAIDDRGRFVINWPDSKPIPRFRQQATGLGRSIVIHESLGIADFNSKEWKRAVAQLWKVRADKMPQILETGFWSDARKEAMESLTKQNEQQQFGRMVTPYGTNTVVTKTHPYAPLHDDVVKLVRHFLLPTRIQGVPLAAVVVLLGLYLLSVAPGDYFLLGKLNARKYTWLLFAVTSAGFTWGAVSIAQRHMGTADYHTSIVFADVAVGPSANDEPAVVRSNRFDMMFVSLPGTKEIALKNTIYTDLNGETLYADEADRQSRRWGGSSPLWEEGETDLVDGPVDDLPIYSGVVPANFTVQQKLRQWAPRVNRQSTFGDEAGIRETADIDWKKIREINWRNAAGRRALKGLVEATEPKAQIVLMGNKVVYMISESQFDAGVKRTQISFQPSNEIDQLKWLISTTSTRDTGFFSYVSRIAPTGGEYVEDLSLIDESDVSQWMLAIAVMRGSEWIVYRYLREFR